MNNSQTRPAGHPALSRTIHRRLLAVLALGATLTAPASEISTDPATPPPKPNGERVMKPPQPDIVHRDGFLVMGTVTRRSPATDHPGMFVSIWNDFEALHSSIKPHSLDSRFYGVSFTPGPDGSFDYLAAMAVKPLKEIPPGLEVRAVPAATFAVFACPVQAIGETYRYIFGEWRSRSGYDLESTKPIFEQYPPVEDTTSPVLIHVPIREASAKRTLR